MQSNSKDKPRSCSCHSCKIARGCGRVGQLMKKEERAFRHRANQAVRTAVNVTENVTPAFSGKRYG